MVGLQLSAYSPDGGQFPVPEVATSIKSNVIKVRFALVSGHLVVMHEGRLGSDRPPETDP